MAGPIQTIIFDLDGTLIDTELAAAQSTRECFESWGIQIQSVDAEYITGRTWESAFEYLFGKYEIPLPPSAVGDQLLECYRRKLETHLPLVPGGAEAVRSLAGFYRLGLVSGSGRREILWALDQMGIRGHFDVILGAEDYLRSKPAPDGYLRALELLRGTPQNGLVFEDSNAGIASALAAGLWVVAITGTNHFNQNTTGAHERIRDLSDVNPAWIESLVKRLR